MKDNLRQNLKRGLVAAVGLIYGSFASATVDCKGAVTNLSLQLTNTGTVTISLSGGPSFTYLCDIAGAGRNDVAPAVCKAMYASLLTAKATNKQVILRFYNYNACNEVPSWDSAGAVGWTSLLVD